MSSTPQIVSVPEVRWERLLPREFDARQKAAPVAYLPLGTVEWHGLHNALGLDSLKAHDLCIRAAQRGGGVVHPPHYGGMGGLDKPATVVVEPEHTWDNHLLRPWLEKLCEEFVRQGFRAVVMLTGHYGHNQQIVVRETAVRMTERLDVPVWGLPEYWLAMDVGYTGDHAGIGETSLLWHLEPGLVAIDRIKDDPDYGRDDTIAKGASPQLGERYAATIVERMATVAAAMLTWDADTRAAFVRAERAIVSAQVLGWRRGDAWAAWKNMWAPHKLLTDYAPRLIARDFAGIENMARQLSA